MSARGRAAALDRRAWLRGVAGGIAGLGGVVGLGAIAPATAQDGEAAMVEVLRRGGVTVMLRHATTTPGIGDPPGFRAGVCSTQRNLSDEGRAQAERIGAWFRSRGLEPAAVRSSAWCRCIDTARLAFGRHEPWPAIDSFFGDAQDGRAQREPVLRAGLQAIAPGRFEVWVTHQVNISELTGSGVAMGEGLVVAAGPRLLGRLGF